MRTYEAAFLDQIVAEGPIGYAFIIVVFEERATDPFLFVTSEKNNPEAGAEIFHELGLEPDTMLVETGRSHFCAYATKEAHHSLGDSDDWADQEKFEIAAFKIFAEQLVETPVLLLACIEVRFAASGISSQHTCFVSCIWSTEDPSCQTT